MVCKVSVFLSAILVVAAQCMAGSVTFTLHSLPSANAKILDFTRPNEREESDRDPAEDVVRISVFFTQPDSLNVNGQRAANITVRDGEGKAITPDADGNFVVLKGIVTIASESPVVLNIEFNRTTRGTEETTNRLSGLVLDNASQLAMRVSVPKPAPRTELSPCQPVYQPPCCVRRGLFGRCRW